MAKTTKSIEVLPTSGPRLLTTEKLLQFANRLDDMGEPDFYDYSSGSAYTPAENAYLDAGVKDMEQKREAQERRDRAISMRIRNWLSEVGSRIRWR